MKKYLTTLCLTTNILFAQSFTGIISPQYDLQLSLATDGLVKKVEKKEGNLVKKDEAILVLDNKLQSLETQRRKIIWQDNSKLNNLVQQKKIIQKRYDDALELYNQTKSISYDEITSIKLKLDEIESEIKYNSENEKREKLEYTISKEMLDGNVLKSPIEDVVSKIGVDIGEWVKAGEPIVNIINSKICYVEFNIEKSYLNEIKNKDKVDIIIDDKDSKIPKEAKVEFISPIADKSSGLILVRVEINNSDDSITPGLSATLSFDNMTNSDLPTNEKTDDIIKSLRPLN